jgi:alpha-L-arabinofuranosidase
MKTVGFYVAVLSSVKEISGRIVRYPGCRMLHRDDIGNDEGNGRRPGWMIAVATS